MAKPEIPDLDFQVRPTDYKGHAVMMPDHPSRRVMSATIWDYEYMGWHIYDADIWYACADCGESSQMHLPNASLEEIAEISSYAGTDLRLGYVKDPARFLFDIEDGAWSWRGTWVEYPDYVSEIKLEEKMAQAKKTRRESQTIKMAIWFVENILHEMDEARVWTTQDFHSAHTKHAADLLKRHSVRDICGTCEAVRDGVIGDGIAEYFTKMAMIETSGEPPLISQWHTYLQEPPPVYLESEYADWLSRKVRDYAEVMVEKLEPAQANEAVDLDNSETKKPRTRKKKSDVEQMELM